MKPRIWIVGIVAFLTGILSLYLFTDWVTPKRIQIIVQNRTVLVGARRAVAPVSFMLNGTYRLTRIEVVPLSSAPTKPAAPVWELTSRSNSVPVHGFLYGQKLRGMLPEPSVPKAEPLTLQAPYRLMVQAGRAKGTVDFRIAP
jgi:hypothetical protein